MSRLGFFDGRKTLMATVEGEASFGMIHRPYTGQTAALKVNGVIVARAEDVDGLRWVVERRHVVTVDAAAVARNGLGDNGRSFAATSIVTLEG